MFGIFDTIKDGLIGVIGYFVDLIPGIGNFDVLTVPELIHQIATACKFFLPMNDIYTIFVLTCGITLLRIALSILHLFKSFTSSILSKLF